MRHGPCDPRDAFVPRAVPVPREEPVPCDDPAPRKEPVLPEEPAPAPRSGPLPPGRPYRGAPGPWAREPGVPWLRGLAALARGTPDVLARRAVLPAPLERPAPERPVPAPLAPPRPAAPPRPRSAAPDRPWLAAPPRPAPPERPWLRAAPGSLLWPRPAPPERPPPWPCSPATLSSPLFPDGHPGSALGNAVEAAPGRERPRLKMSGGVLLSHAVPRAVPSALKSLTSGFGMEPGVSPSPWPPKLYGDVGTVPAEHQPQPGTAPTAPREPHSGRET